jgi:hypothetical protein
MDSARLSKNLRPLARKERLIVENLEGETLIYDAAADKAHCLNPTAALIWKSCDGKHTLPQLEAILPSDLSRDNAGAVVRFCLQELSNRKLLSDDHRTSLVQAEHLTRRSLLRKIGVAAAASAVAIPLVTSIVAPRPAAAASCIPPGAFCIPGISKCCSNHSCHGGGQKPCP